MHPKTSEAAQRSDLTQNLGILGSPPFQNQCQWKKYGLALRACVSDPPPLFSLLLHTGSKAPPLRSCNRREWGCWDTALAWGPRNWQCGDTVWAQGMTNGQSASQGVALGSPEAAGRVRHNRHRRLHNLRAELQSGYRGAVGACARLSAVVPFPTLTHETGVLAVPVWRQTGREVGHGGLAKGDGGWASPPACPPWLRGPGGALRRGFPLVIHTSKWSSHHGNPFDSYMLGYSYPPSWTRLGAGACPRKQWRVSLLVPRNNDVHVCVQGGGEGGFSWAVNLVWEIWHFNLATKFTTRNPGVKSRFCSRAFSARGFKLVFWECPPNFPQPNEPLPD